MPIIHKEGKRRCAFRVSEKPIIYNAMAEFTCRRAACWRLKATLLHLVDLFVNVTNLKPTVINLYE